MGRFLFRRAGFLLLTVLLTSLVVFLITQWLPGDVARVILGREAGEAALQALRQELGLNEPLVRQYLNWVGDLAGGSWGRSFSTGADILPLVTGRLRNSIMLAVVIFVMAVPVAIGLGVLAGLRRDSWLDNVISISALSVVGLPEFVTGLVLIQVFALGLGWFPANSSIPLRTPFLQALPMLILPAATASLVLIAYIARLTRAGVVEELDKAYVRTAVLKGLPMSVVTVKHVLRNALLPTITVIAISLGWMISGLIVIENVFNYPGLGRLLVFAIDRRDLPLLQAVTMVTVVVFAGANMIADVLYAALNPTIRLE